MGEKNVKQAKFDYPKGLGLLCVIFFLFCLPITIHSILGNVGRPEIGKHFKSSPAQIGSSDFTRISLGFHPAAQQSILPCCKTILPNPLINVRPHFSINESRDEMVRFTNFIEKVCCSLWLDKCPDGRGCFFLFLTSR